MRPPPADRAPTAAGAGGAARQPVRKGTGSGSGPGEARGAPLHPSRFTPPHLTSPQPRWPTPPPRQTAVGPQETPALRGNPPGPAPRGSRRPPSAEQGSGKRWGSPGPHLLSRQPEHLHRRRRHSRAARAPRRRVYPPPPPRRAARRGPAHSPAHSPPRASGVRPRALANASARPPPLSGPPTRLIGAGARATAHPEDGSASRLALASRHARRHAPCGQPPRLRRPTARPAGPRGTRDDSTCPPCPRDSA